MRKQRISGVPVTMRALVQRINRSLAKRDGCVHGFEHGTEHARKCIAKTVLKATRGRARFDLGDFYILDVSRNAVSRGTDPEHLGRKLGVLQPWEQVTDDGGAHP